MTDARSTETTAASQYERAQLENIALIKAQRNCDATYQREYAKFVLWVDGNPELNAPPYITRENIDHFFTIVVAKRPGGRNHINRVASAITWHAKHGPESIHLPPDFKVKSSAVMKAMEAQRAYNASVGGTGNPGSDPQKGLKDNLSIPDRIRIMKYVYAHRADDWGPCSVSLNWGNNGAIRGASNRKLTYADLKISFGYGAEEEGRLSRSLILVLRKGEIHKTRSDTDHQVSCWRHKNYLLCSVFSTSAFVIWSLSNNSSINFYQTDRSKAADWWTTPFIDWEVYSDAGNAMKTIFGALNLELCKLTHFRTWAVQNGGFRGLRPDQVNTLTDHKTEKQHSAYKPVAEYETSRIMAGFINDEAYFCPRAIIQLDNSIDWYTKKLLPSIDSYRRQHQSAMGDKTEMCRRFLYELIPWMIEVVVQDGIYFVKDFPSHPISNMLKVSAILYLKYAVGFSCSLSHTFFR